MHVDELEQSLRDLAAGQPPVAPGGPAVRRRHRNVRAAQVGAAIVTVIALVAGVAMWTSSDTTSSGLHVVTGPNDTLPIDPALARCFPTLAPRLGDKAGAIVDGSTMSWPSTTADLLVLTDRGELSVIHAGEVANWGAGYLWARWGQDGSIYASRLEGSAVVIDRLTGPGQATAVVQLPFTMKAGAPAGYCAMDGYQADFSIGPGGMLLLPHQAGPVQHSCPALPPTVGSADTTENQWRCASPESVGWEVRKGDYTSRGTDLGGGDATQPIQVLADSTNSGVVALAGGHFTLNAATGFCCGSLGASATAYALSPDGTSVVSSPDGRKVRVDEAPSGGPSDLLPGSQLWISPDDITDMAWSGDWLAVVHGHTLTLVSTTASGQVIDVATVTGPVRDLDWSG
jgi:hypothetical protein